MSGWEILQQIWRLQQVVLREATPCLERHGLFRMAPFALAMVRRCGTPSGVANALGLPAPTVSHILRRLEAEGWVVRQVDPGDLRRYRLALTPAGQEALAAARACLEAVMDRRLECLAPAERDALRRLLARLQEDLPPSGVGDVRAAAGDPGVDPAGDPGVEREGAVPREGTAARDEPAR
ncbi:transcriptional regulator, MarR family [Thermaerobacter marianensis DSM 12885]|uniref:Transcriptional regulator, MarR family n=1 Tax=Thermaerobacter marianensis (strain ATCC 700841 / DSM 12885 / JCM 10246 / 7p75a) TaxID=644966 RepID=E6SGZ4_THEM7|nr:MarR family transcriptional regulator [Thermaerobacter marianensis]ADU50625.1 transcriptional regulator, MarR family [Thermaerobacter marianensis DSM 12885]